MPRTPMRLTVLACCVSSAFAYAEQAETTLGTVTVTGQSASLNNALDVQQAVDHIVSAVMADDIGKLPDDNAAEALQRVPGVSIERDQGEGRYVRIRGLGPDYNTVNINGAQTPSPDSDRRAVALDVVPASLIRSIELHKSFTPDQDANSLGGTVDIKTLTGFDHPGRFASVDAEASHDSNSGRTSPKFSGVFADRLGPDKKLGVAAGLSYEGRRFGSDNVETGGAWDMGQGGAGKAGLKEVDMRRYDIKRERIGGLLNLDYRPDAQTQYYWRTMGSRFSDTETRQGLAAEFDDPLAAGGVGEAALTRSLKSRKETQSIFSTVLGTEQRLGNWKLAAALAASQAGEKTPLGISGAKFAGKDTFDGVGYSSTSTPVLSGPASMYDASQYALDKLTHTRADTRDKLHSIKLDLGRDWRLGKDTLEFKFGGKLSRRKKTNDTEMWTYKGKDLLKQGFSANDLSLSALGSGDVSYGLGAFGPGISAGALNQLVGGLNAADFYDEEGSRISDFAMQEDINAAYMQATWSTGPWRILGGVRYEGTRFSAKGTGMTDGDFSEVASHTQYHHWLPALHVRRDFGDDTTLRAAYTHSVMRPTFGQLSPNFVIDDDEAEFGNPNLKPLQSRNFDLGVEHRFGFASMVSAYVFRKNIKNFVYQSNVAGTGDWANFDRAITYVNGDKAHVHGLELAYSQSFRDVLPAPWNGLLLGANVTFSRSNARVSGQEDGATVARDIQLPSQSNTTYNLMVGYETGPWSMRVAMNHKSPYLYEVGSMGNSRQDIRVDAHTQVDLALSYRITPQTRLSFQAVNITNEKYYAYTGSKALNAQYEKYGPIYKIGLTHTF